MEIDIDIDVIFERARDMYPPHTTIYVSSYYYMCVLILLCVSSYCYVCVLILLYMCRLTAALEFLWPGLLQPPSPRCGVRV
jgi:hypothetical protein